MRVYELRQRTDLTELNNREDVSVVKEQAGIDCQRCRTIFARTERGEYVEVWGTRSVRPNEQDDAHEHELDLISCDRCGTPVPAANIKTSRDGLETVCAECRRRPEVSTEPTRDSE